MAATGHFYKKHTDVGAPSLTPTAGSLIAVLDWVLDTGTATYWEKVYSGTNKAVYRSKTGIRPYLRIDDNYGEGAFLRLYETMTDVDTGTGAVPNGVNQDPNYFRICKCDLGEAGAHAYHAVGDSEFFILAINGDESYSASTGPSYFRPFYFGEIASYLAVDNYPCIIGAQSEPTFDSDYNDVNADLWGVYGGQPIYASGGDNSTVPDPNTAELYWMRTANGSTVGSGGKPWVWYSGVLYRLDIVENPAVILPFHIQCSNGINSGSADAFWNSGNGGAVTRARLPYAYEGKFMPGPSYGGPDPEDIITIGTSQYIVLPCLGQSTGVTWAQTRTGLLRITDDEPDRS